MSRFIALLVIAAAVCGTAVPPAAAASPTIADIVVGASSTGGPDANPDDFELPEFTRLLDNGIRWAAD